MTTSIMAVPSQTIPAVNELAAALSRAQGEIRNAVKDSANPFFKSRYADLASVWEACRAPLCKHGLSVVQTTDVLDSGGVVLITTLLHSSGQYVQGRYPVQPVKNDPQALGSAVTYARRYALQAIVGIAPDDDDGEAAMAREQKAQSVHAMVQPQPRPQAEAKPDYVVSFGKYKDKRLTEIAPEDLSNYVGYLHRKAKEDRKEIQGAVKEFIDHAEAFLKS